MNITNTQFERIKAIYSIIPAGRDFFKQDATTQEIILYFDQTIKQLDAKRAADNKRISQYIANKRKNNKNYAR